MGFGVVCATPFLQENNMDGIIDKVTKELAEEEFITWCEANEIECDESELSDEGPL